MPDLKNMGRSFLAVFAAGAGATIIILIIQNIGINLYPPSPELTMELNSPDKAVQKAAYRQLIMLAPTGALVFVLVSYSMGSVAAGWIAARLAPNHPLVHAALIGTCLLGGCILNFSLAPHPTWMVAIGVALFMPATLLGGWLASRQMHLKTLASETGSD